MVGQVIEIMGDTCRKLLRLMFHFSNSFPEDTGSSQFWSAGAAGRGLYLLAALTARGDGRNSGGTGIIVVCAYLNMNSTRVPSAKSSS
jgi:hypothetical protein